MDSCDVLVEKFHRRVGGANVGAWPKWLGRIVTCTCWLLLLWTGPTTCNGGGTGTSGPTPIIREINVYSAVIALTYKDAGTGSTLHVEQDFIGRYGLSSRVEEEAGLAVHVRSVEGDSEGCSPPVNVPVLPVGVRWIALVQRGGCKFHHKVFNNAVLHNASAVVVYNNEDEKDLITMEHFFEDVVTVFIHKEEGEEIARLVDAGATVELNISLGQVITYRVGDSSSATPGGGAVSASSPLLIISLTLIVLLICGLTALLVYGIRRSKYQTHKSTQNIMFVAQESGEPWQGLLPASVGPQSPTKSLMAGKYSLAPFS